MLYPEIQFVSLEKFRNTKSDKFLVTDVVGDKRLVQKIRNSSAFSSKYPVTVDQKFLKLSSRSIPNKFEHELPAEPKKVSKPRQINVELPNTWYPSVPYDSDDSDPEDDPIITYNSTVMRFLLPIYLSQETLSRGSILHFHRFADQSFQLTGWPWRNPLPVLKKNLKESNLIFGSQVLN